MLSSTSRTLTHPLSGRRPARPAVGPAVLALLRRAGLAVWHRLEEVGQARANRELNRLADSCAVADPERARQLRAASRFDVRGRDRDRPDAQSGEHGNG